jgi:YD repeat-containing protein
MGRVIKTSNPTETSASGTPSQWTTAGDDASAGWIYVQQTYDWKGRPLVTTNQDGTTRTAAYSGCGCAGGEVVTVTDEGTLDGGVAKRRQQKIYSDVLGRTRKTEVLNWENGSPYSTTVTTYNARDQVIQVREYAGSESSSTYQDSSMTYDGFGRLQTVHRPEQQPQPNNTASSDHTTFYYNLDDTVAFTIDARGVKKSFSYNERHFVTSINYDLSLIPPAYNFVVPTASQTFAYDAAGNRTSMSDSTGTVSYQYNSLSQLNSETRTFAGPFSGTSFTLTYTHNLGGEIQSLALPSQFGTSLMYDYDAAGRLTGVTGLGYTYNDTPNSQAPVSSFMANAAYRAWNDLKQVNTGSLSQTNFTYDQQLRPTSYNLTAGSQTYTWNYSYYADGKVKMVSDLANDHFDKAYAYDHVGRMTEAYSGREARGLEATNPTPDSPFRQSFSYSAFDQQLRETGRIWQRPMSGQVFSYINNRRQDLLYDAMGRVTADSIGNHVFDAAGERILVTVGTVGGGETGHVEMPAEELSVSYGADGQPVKNVTTTRTESLVGNGPQTWISEEVETTYYLRSTALGGYVVGELNAQGQKTRQYVYAGGERLAEQRTIGNYTSINWQHRNPLTDSWVSVDPNQSFSFRTEVDAHGRETGLEPPVVLPNEPPPPPTRDPSYLEMEGGQTIEAELGMQLYEDFFLNHLYNKGYGPAEGGYDRFRTVREAQLRAGGTFLFGQDRMVATAFGEYEEKGFGLGLQYIPPSEIPPRPASWRPVTLTYYQLKPGSPKKPRDFSHSVKETQKPVPSPGPDPTEHYPLTACNKSRLAPYFPGVDLDKVQIRFGFGGPTRLAGKALDAIGIQTLNGADALTVGNTIYFRSKEVYNPDSIAGIALIGHELRHVEQSQHGKFGDVQYVHEYLELRKMGLSDYDAYRSISSEREAFKTQDIIKNDLEHLKKQLGGDAFWSPCPPH